MKTKTVKKTESKVLISRKPSKIIYKKGKLKIVEEIKSDTINYLGASRKYWVSKNSIKA